MAFRISVECSTAQRQSVIFSITKATCWIVKAVLPPFMAMVWVKLYSSKTIKSARTVRAIGMTTPELIESA